MKFVKPEQVQPINPEEEALCRAGGVDPEEYVTLTVSAQLAPGAPAQLTRGMMDGEVVEGLVTLWLVSIPIEALAKVSRLIDATGNIPNPIHGSANFAQMRLLLPRKLLKPELVKPPPEA